MSPGADLEGELHRGPGLPEILSLYASGSYEESTSGGAGGAKTQEGCVMPGLTRTIGGRPASIDSAQVDTVAPDAGPESRIGCNIGQDVIGQFEEAVLNFRSTSM